jgi:signal transduction histidine kinase
MHQKSSRRYSLSWRSLSSQLFLVIILPLTALLLVIIFGSFTLHQQAMRSLVGERDQRAVQTAAKALEAEIDHRTASIQNLALRFSPTNSQTPAEILSSSGYLLHDFDRGMGIYTRDGKLAASNGDPSFWERLSQEKPQELSAALSQAGSTPAISTAFPDPATGKPVVLVSIPAQTWIAMGAFTPAALIQSTLGDAFPTGNQESVFVLESSGQILYQSGSLSPNTNPCNHPDIVLICKNQGGITYVTVGSNEHVVTYSSIAPIGWGLVTEESWQSVESPLLQNTLFAPLVLVPILLISLAALWFGARQVIRPLQKLEAEAVHLSQGDFQEIEKPVGGIAEIQHLQDQLIQMAQKVQAAQRSLHDYIGSVTTGQEEERRRIARDLHDDTIQSLIALKQRVQLARLESQNGSAEQMRELETLAEETIENLRRTIRALRPIYLEDLGLVTALEMLVKETEATSGLTIDFQRKGMERRLSPQAELALYRMAQEAVSNVVRHSSASQAWLSIEFQLQTVLLETRDNGKGFTVPEGPSEFAPGGHFGLLGLHERAELIGAELRITSSPSKGTSVRVVYPG